MIGKTARFLWLRWLAALLLGLLWATMGNSAASAERGDFGHSSLAAKTTAGAKEPISPGAHGFMAGEKKLAELSADEVANAIKGYQQAADAAKSAAHRAYQEARIRALRGEADPPGQLLDFMKNFREGGGN